MNESVFGVVDFGHGGVSSRVKSSRLSSVDKKKKGYSKGEKYG